MTALQLLPRNLVIGFIVAWRVVLSPLYGDVCRFHPTCSAYGLRAVQAHGLLRGGWLTARRIVRCHPWSRGGIDDVPEPRLPLGFRFTRIGFAVPNR